MNNVIAGGNKDCDHSDGRKCQSLEKVATVTLCLCDHDKCTGQYVDYTKTYVVKCACGCHNSNNNYDSGLKGDK